MARRVAESAEASPVGTEGQTGFWNLMKAIEKVHIRCSAPTRPGAAWYCHSTVNGYKTRWYLSWGTKNRNLVEEISGCEFRSDLRYRPILELRT